MKATRDTIEALLRDSLHPQHLVVQDISEQHRHHKQAPKGQGHYHINISDECLTPTNRIMQHRAIYTILAPLMDTKIHALKISILKTPYH